VRHADIQTGSSAESHRSSSLDVALQRALLIHVVALGTGSTSWSLGITSAFRADGKCVCSNWCWSDWFALRFGGQHLHHNCCSAPLARIQQLCLLYDVQSIHMSTSLQLHRCRVLVYSGTIRNCCCQLATAAAAKSMPCLSAQARADHTSIVSKPLIIVRFCLCCQGIASSRRQQSAGASSSRLQPVLQSPLHQQRSSSHSSTQSLKQNSSSHEVQVTLL
jgi:hypothetical protein